MSRFCAFLCGLPLIWAFGVQAAPSTQQQAAALQAEEAEVSERLDALDREIENAKKALSEGQQRLETLRSSRVQIEEQKRALDLDLSKKQSLLARRLKARYFLKQASVWQLFLSTVDPLDWIRRQTLLDRVLKADLRLIRETKAQRASLEALNAQLLEAMASEDAARRHLEQQRAEAAAEREKKASLLEEVRGRRAEFEALLARRERERSSLVVAQKPLPQNEESGFAQKKGRLPRPLSGALLRGFGAAMAVGSRSRCKGIEWVAPIGTPVHAVADGKVIYSGWYQGYGNLVIIDHGGDYHTLYGHLDAINRVSGESVAAGTQIGESGDSGSLFGPMLYFELRYKGKPQNPAPWLGAR